MKYQGALIPNADEIQIAEALAAETLHLPNSEAFHAIQKSLYGRGLPKRQCPPLVKLTWLVRREFLAERKRQLAGALA